MSKDSDLFGVVVIGAMNPRIHHPAWYQLVKLISGQEAEHATQTQPVVCTPAYSQFGLGEIDIKCLPDRWDITTRSSANIDRIREIAQRLFDDVLLHTPVNIVALNFEYVRQVSGANATEIIARKLNVAAGELGLGNAEAGDLFLKRALVTNESVQGIATVIVRTADSSDMFGLSCNYQYTIRLSDGLFRFDAFLPEYAQRDRVDAEQSLARLTSAIASARKD